MNGGDRSPAPSSKGHLNPTEHAPIARYDAAADLRDVVRHFWVPEWDLPSGHRLVARVLSYPALNIVVSPDGVLVSGPGTRITERELTGRGWAVGALLRPAATPSLTDDVRSLIDAVHPLEAPGLADRVTDAMGRGGPRRHAAACEVVSDWLRDHVAPPSPAGLLANAAANIVEEDADLVRVEMLAERLGVSVRSLQRAVASCTGFTPAQLLRRRRLQEATDRMRREPATPLARLAGDVGYADQAHMSRDFTDTLDVAPSAFRRLNSAEDA